MLSEKKRRRWRSRLSRILRPVWLLGLRGTTPLSYDWGFDRGTPVDRYYIEHFLAAHRDDIRGRVLEVAEDSYTRHFGSGVERADVLDLNSSNAQATLIADLAHADSIPSDSFDCFILTQTLHCVYDFQRALGQAQRLLRPGGVLLASMPVVSRLCTESNLEDYWRFTPTCCSRFFGEIFGGDNVQVISYGNVLTAAAFLYGLACEELSARELDTPDPLFPMLVCVRAIKP